VLDVIERYLTWQRATAEPFNERIKGCLREAIEARKAKVLKDRNSVANLGFKLKGRADAPKTYVAPVVRKKIVPTIPKPRRTFPFIRFGIQLCHALLTTILFPHNQLHHAGMITFSDALFSGH